MIVKILGVLDILSAMAFWLFAFFHIIPESLITIIAFYLLVKGIIFLISLDVASALDIIVSVLMFVSLTFALPNIVVFLISLYLLQKGVLSLAT